MVRKPLDLLRALRRAYSFLANATDDQSSAVRLRAEGTALRRDELDEDIGVSRILKGLFETA